MTETKSRFLLAAAVSTAITLSASGPSRADIAIYEWLGDWTLYHDGHTATLAISELKADCAGPPWCAMVARYTGPGGNRSPARIVSIDNQGQHMVFEVDIMHFDGYLFSWDHAKMAGSYARQGDRTYGFYAIKRR
jgi:hypothetical protein